MDSASDSLIASDYQLLLGAVVDVALDPSPLGILRGDQAPPRRPQVREPGRQLLPEPDVAQHEPDLRGEVKQ